MPGRLFCICIEVWASHSHALIALSACPFQSPHRMTAGLLQAYCHGQLVNDTPYQASLPIDMDTSFFHQCAAFH